MSKGGKPVNYRSGDRSESMGIPLLQMMCAVAPVPRPEDWGVFDAVATLLSQEAGLLYAEESFMVQFKGRTVEHIDYEERKLEALLQQDLALFAARVDLRECSISLFALGLALRHPNISDHEKVRIHLGVCLTYNFTQNQHVESSPLANTVYGRRISQIPESDEFGAIYLLS